MDNKEILERIERLEEILNPHIDFVRIRDVKMPSRATSNDAGTDWFIPNYSETFIDDLNKKNVGRKFDITTFAQYSDKTGKDEYSFEITLHPHERILIPSGLKVNIHNKWSYLKVDNKSGVANTYGLIFGADIIDADYRGEAHISLINTSDSYVKLSSGQKIIQVIHSLKLDTKWNEITQQEFDALPSTQRGEGGFGHSGTK